MTGERGLTVVAGAATLLAATGFLPIFETWNWMFYASVGIAVTTAAAVATRALRGPRWAPPIVSAVALFVLIVVMFADGALFVVLPTPTALGSLAELTQQGIEDVAVLAPPVPDRRGLLLLTTVGVALAAMLVDLIAVTMRKPALSGLVLLSIYAVPVAIDRAGLPAPSFTAAAAGYLWLLVTSQVTHVLGWGRPLGTRIAPGAAGVGATQGDAGGGEPDDAAAAREPFQGGTPLGATGRRLGVLGIAVAVLVPLLLPGLSQADLAGLQDRLGLGDNSRSVQTINPITQLSGQLNQQSNTPLILVRSNESEPNYLRLTTLDNYTGNGWEQTRDRLRASSRDRVSELETLETDIDPTIARSGHSAQITIAGLDVRYLPVFPNPTRVDVDGDWRFHRDLDTVFSAKTSTRDRSYQVSFDTAEPTVTQLAAAPLVPAGSPLRPSFTELGSGQPAPTVRQIHNDIVRGKESQYEKVQAIREFFNGNGFSYTLKTRPGTGQDALADFLDPRTGREGYCEQYASAMAYLVRLADIPARVAIGFTGGTVRGGERVISARNAHAWVEVYYQDVGWVPYDPTPPGGAEGVAGDTADFPWEQPVTDSADGADASASASAAPTGQTTAPSNPDDLRNLQDQTIGDGGAGDADRSWWSRLISDPAGTLWQIRWWLIGFIVVTLLLTGPYLARRLLRRRRLAAAGAAASGRLSAAASAHAAWAELVDTMTDFGTPLDEAETPRAVAARLIRDLELDRPGASAVAVLAKAEEEARYAPEGAGDRAVGDLNAATRTVVRQLADSTDRRSRLRALLLPASLFGLLGDIGRRLDDTLSTSVHRITGRLFRR